MGISPLLVTFVVGALAFVLLPRLTAPSVTVRAKEIAMAALAAINVAGVFGLGWFVIEILTYDGVMVLEMLSCIVLLALLAGFTRGAYALRRRGKSTAAISLLAVGAVPTVLVYGFLVYLDLNPIDWK